MHFPMHKNNMSAQTNRLHSPNVWADCPLDSIKAGYADGIYFFDDFTDGGIITSPTTEAALVGKSWSGFGSSGSTITYDDAAGGGLVLTEATDNEGNVLNHDQHPFVISNVSGSLWWEARVKASSITASGQSWMAGLVDTTAATVSTPLIASTGAIADTNFVGFHKPELNTTTFNNSYRSDGNSIVIVNTGVGTLAVSTYLKLAMRFNSSDKKLRFYINGVECATAKTIVDALGTTFPSDVRLGLVFAQGLGAGTSTTFTIDWVAAAQLV